MEGTNSTSLTAGGHGTFGLIISSRIAGATGSTTCSTITLLSTIYGTISTHYIMLVRSETILLFLQFTVVGEFGSYFEAASQVQSDLQPVPPSHSSPLSMTPFPQT